MSRAQLTSTVEQNTGGAVAPYVAGKNFVINGGMDIWQRGTSFTSPSNFSYTADRWACYQGSTVTLSQETSNVPAGSRYALKMNATATQQMFIRQVIETANTIPLAGKTITVSAQIAASASTTLGFTIAYSTNVDETVSTIGAWNTLTPTGGLNSGSYSNVPTTYVTLVGTYTVPSNAKSLLIYFGNFSATVTSGTSFYISQVQLELGSVPTAFSRAGGTLSGELTACQRYYYQPSNTSANIGVMGATSTTGVARLYIAVPVPMRGNTASVSYTGTPQLYDGVATISVTSIAFNTISENQLNINIGVASGLTQYRPYSLYLNGGTILVSSEL